MVALLILSGLLEGIGLAALLPVLEIAGAGGAPGETTIGRLAMAALGLVGWTPTLAALLGVVVLAITAKAILRWLAMREVAKTVADVASDLRMRLLRAMMAARWSYFTTERTGHFANALSAEAPRAAFAYRSACTALAALIQITVYGAVAVMVSWQLAALAVVGGGVITVLLGWFVRASRRAGGDYTRSLRSLAAAVTDISQGMKALKAMGRDEPLLTLLERRNDGVQGAEQRLLRSQEALHAFHEPIVAVAVALGLYGAASWGGHPLSAVLLLAFLFYRVVGRFHILQAEYQGIASAESAFWSLETQVQAAERARESFRGRRRPPALRDGIVLRDVVHEYEGRIVLDGISLRIPAGEFIAIIGRSGAGKTTLIDLIVGLDAPLAGEILVDGVPLHRIHGPSWRRQIGYIPQDPILLHDTIARNVSIGVADATREGIASALDAAGAWDFVARLPAGMDAEVGERGLKLSGGERQRLAIARALLDNPKLLILDEATAGLDAKAEREICDTLRRLRGSHTIVAVSHHPTVAQAADAVHDLDAAEVRQPRLAHP